MSGGELIVIFHYDGEFKFDMIHPIYDGGKQKMRSVKSDITFPELVKIALESSQWEETCENLSIHYLHHNGHVFSLAAIEDDNDIKCMLTLANHKTNGIYLYINRREVASAKYIGEHRRSFGMDFCSSRGKQIDFSGSNHNVKCKVPSIQCVDIPTVNLNEDNDFHFSEGQNIGSDELAKESCCAPVDCVNMVNMPDEGKFVAIQIDSGKTGNDLAGSSSIRGQTVPILNVGEQSSHKRKVIFEDDMVQDEFETELEQNSSREMWLGREFANRDEFRRTLAKFAIYSNFTLQHLKTQQFKVTARCKEVDCPWRIHASMIESGPRFKVRTYNPTHKCSKPMMGTAHRQASSELIAEYILDKVRLNHNIRPKEIMNDYQMEFGVTISYRKAHMARDIALRIVRGSYEDSFKILPLYCEELKMMNPGTVTNIQTSDDDKFKRFFWSFGACIRSFTSSLRPVIAVDGTHLRGKYPGILMVSVTLDANHKLFPIAFAFAEAERRDSWEWFLANLSLCLGEPTNLTIVSDRQKGLVPALANTIPSASHCYCCRHLAENIKSTFKDPAIAMKFWCAAKAYRTCEYEAFMEDIRAVNQDAFNYINGFGRQHWANAYVEGRRYDMLTSNAAECTNSMLKDTRALPIVKQVEEIRARLMEFFHKRHAENLNINSRLTPYAEKMLGHETEEARRLQVRVAGLVEFQVQSANYVDIVHLDRRTCTCHKWEVLGIPCSHAIASMRVRNYNPYDFCDNWYLTSMLQTTYSEVIHATRDSKQWEHSSNERVLPPLASRQPGRPKKNRTRTEDQYRLRRVFTCSNCNERGHNRQTCRNPPAQS